MRVLFLNTSDSKGGAAIAAKRLMDTLRKEGIDVSMIVRDKATDDPAVIKIRSSKWMNKIRFMYERLGIFIHNGFNRENLFAVSQANTGVDISRYNEVKRADIIHIHWINQGFLSLKDVQRLVAIGKPIVWTMHDMWPCTGICHHARDCVSFMSQCGGCFFLQSKKERDLSTAVFQKKQQWIFFEENITMVGCSQWLARKAKISALTKNHRVVSIPNPIDIQQFKSYSDKENCRRRLGLPEHKQLILFGAANVTDKRKGIYYLIDAINRLLVVDPCLAEKMGIVAFGEAKAEFVNLVKIPVYPLGYVFDVSQIVALYNAIDVFVTSSLEENLPNTIMEAMACGVPCVGFRIGGIPEMIDHKENGYIAAYKDADDLAAGIDWMLNKADRDELSRNARRKVEENYSEAVVAKQYIQLYQRLLR
ncbi:glycosyl transferase [Tannerella sp. oral taxon 808]|nr:glycosyl transferase [Tannerella sp. oral taxon 808]